MRAVTSVIVTDSLIKKAFQTFQPTLNGKQLPLWHAEDLSPSNHQSCDALCPNRSEQAGEGKSKTVMSGREHNRSTGCCIAKCWNTTGKEDRGDRRAQISLSQIR